MDQEKVIVIDFGGQYNQLVARRVRECNVYCEIYSYKTDLAQIKAMNPKGIILTGGPNSCYEDGAPTCTKELFELGVPVLGLCYGAQLMQHVLGGKVEKAPVREYGKTETFVDKSSALFSDVSEKTIVWMSHFDYISQIAPGFKIVAHTADCPVAAAECTEKNLYAIQFHPEVLHTQEGTKMLHNFVRGVCGCAGTWKMDAFVENTIKEIREKVGSGKVLLALSGGVDSSVAAGLLSRAIGKQLTCVFVDHGLLRKDEGDEVESVFGPEGQFDLNFIRVNAQERYYSKLAGVTEPEAKRKIIGEEFIRVFEEEAKKIGAVDFLAQGTIYPDVVESGLGGESAVIKSHHNVGGLPDFVDFKEIIEPLRNLFKDEVRKAGLELGIPEHLVFRQPFPGPGLGIRIIGEVTADKVRIVQDADYIYRSEVDKAVAEYKKANGKAPAWMPNQYFAALTNMRSVGVMGDERTYDYAVALRAVNTIDLEECCIPRPKGTTVFTCEEALEVAHKLGYPVLVRPSYVLGGQGMQIAVSDEDITAFMEVINRYEQEHPILIDKYLVGKEVEVDAVCDGTDILIPGIMEHVERAGIHSGDSISVYPSINLTDRIKRIIAEYTRKLAKSLHVIGLINIQFIVADDEVYVIEVNPRSSRTVPYISKVTGIPIVALAAKVITGAKIRDLGYEPGLQKESEYYAVKKPVFSFEKLRGAEISLGPEMKSTGECLGISKNFHEALYKAFLGAGVNLPKYKKMILTVKDSDKIDAIDIGRRFEALGYEIFSTKSTCRVLNEAGVHAKQINKLEEESPNLLDLILDDKIDLVIDTPSQGVGRSRDGFLIRRYAIETGVTCLTSLDTADALLTSLETGNRDQLSVVDIAQI